MKEAYLLIGIRLGVLVKLLLRNGVSFRFTTLFRLLLLLQNAIFSSVFARSEKFKFGKKIDKTVIDKDPIFIIGHWRTGSTYLHQLLNLDQQFTTPTYTQTLYPDSFIVSSKYFRPFLLAMMSKTRPMDNVRVHPDEPQEDEYGLLRMGAHSPLEDMIFSDSDLFFLEKPGIYDLNEKERTEWIKFFTVFLKKITFESGKRIILKNPFHTMRIGLIREMFPGARFIHIYRNPFHVVPSAINMWDIVSRQNQLKHKMGKPDAFTIAAVYKMFLEKAATLKQNAPSAYFSEVRYEILERNPAVEIERIYLELGLPFTEAFRTAIIDYANKSGDYKKNSFHLSDFQKEDIRKVFGEYLSQYQ